MKVLLVCTGNTCRSAMAKGLLVGEGDFRVRSAGVSADSDSGASPLAIEVLKKRDIDISGHKSSPLSAEAVEWAEVILTMTRRHKATVIGRYPHVAEKVFTIKEYVTDEHERTTMIVELKRLLEEVSGIENQFEQVNSQRLVGLREQRERLIKELEETERQLDELQGELEELMFVQTNRILVLEKELSSPDVLDPYGLPIEVYEACSLELAALIKRVAIRLRNQTVD